MSMRLNINILSRMRDIYTSRHEPESLRAFADIYWRATLALGLLVTTLVVVYGIWNLTRILGDLGAPPYATPPPAPTLDRAALRDAVRLFDTRQTRFEELKKNPPASPADPSRK